MQVATETQRKQPEQAPTDFYDRDREHRDPPFESGEKVTLQGQMRISSNGDVYVDPVYPGGVYPRARTQFIVGNINDKPELQELVGTSPSVVLTVGELKQNFIGHQFSATLTEKPQLHTIKDDSRETLESQRGQYVGISGEIISVTQVPGEYRERAQLKIRQENGSIITLNSHDPEITFEGGTLENVNRKPVQVGDHVRAVAYVMPDSSLSVHFDPYMVKPSEARQREYDVQRTAVQADLQNLGNQIGKEDWNAARVTAATLALSETTRTEQLTLLAHVQSIPEAERPLISERLLEDRYAANQIQENLGINPMGLTKAEFIDFAKNLAAHAFGDIENLSETATFRMFDDAGLSESEQQSVFTHTIAILKPGIAGANSENVPFSERYSLNESYLGLGSINTPESANQLVDTLIDEIRKGNLDPGGPPPQGAPRFESIVSTLTDAIDMRAARNPNDFILQARQRDLTDCLKMLQRLQVEPRAQQDLIKTINTLRNAPVLEMAYTELRLPKIVNS